MHTSPMFSVEAPARGRWPRWFYIAAILIGLLAGELIARSAYYVLYGGQKDRLVRAFMGMENEYDPNMVSNYVPHPYLVYALNPNTQYYYEEFYGKKPQHFINSLGFRGKEFSKEKGPGFTALSVSVDRRHFQSMKQMRQKRIRRCSKTPSTPPSIPRASK